MAGRKCVHCGHDPAAYRRRFTDEQRDAMQRLYEEGKPIHFIADKLGASYTLVRNELVRRGVQFRRRNHVREERS